MISSGLIFKALANARMVRRIGLCLPDSISYITTLESPDNFANSGTDRKAFSLNSFKFGIFILYNVLQLLTRYICMI